VGTPIEDHQTRGSEFIREGDGADSTGDSKKKQAGYQAASLAFDLGRLVKPRWPESDFDSAGKPAWMPD